MSRAPRAGLLRRENGHELGKASAPRVHQSVMCRRQDTETASAHQWVSGERTWHTRARAHTCTHMHAHARTCTHMRVHAGTGTSLGCRKWTSCRGRQGWARGPYAVSEARRRETARNLTSCGTVSKTQLATERGEVGAGGLAERHGCRVKGAALAQCPVLVWTQHVAAGGRPQLS